MKRLITGLTLSSLVLATGFYEANARPQYAAKEQKPCGYCHLTGGGGGARNFRGGFYGANGLSFALFNEEREAALARVEPNSSGEDSVSKIGYITAISVPADKAITARTNISPVLLVFLNTAPDDGTKDAVKMLGKAADAFGRQVSVVGVVKADRDAALKLTSDLGNSIRVLSDPEGTVIAKYKGQMGLDMVVIPKFDPNDTPPAVSLSGYSKQNLDKALDALTAWGITFDKVDTSALPAKPTRGAKLSD